MATAGSEQALTPPPTSPPTYAYPPIIIILTIILLIFLFVGFFSIYCCRCFMQNILCTWHVRQNPTGTPVGGAASTVTAGGLDPLIVQSFPSFAYSTVKEYRKEKYGLECAICLLEFKPIDVLRLLTTCCHVFHQECVDLWLESHDTCPVCRRNLASPAQSPVKSPNSVNEDSISITVKDENDDVNEEKGKGVSCDGDDVQNQAEKFSRSHSTGHSIIRNKNNEEDRFTLRLPDDVKSRLIKGLNSSKSWSTFGEYNKDKDSINTGLAEVTGVHGGDDKV